MTEKINPNAVVPSAGELSIVMDRTLAYACYVGTRAHLEAEGVIPAGTEWRRGYRSIFWDENGISFALQRARPKGAKGPRREFEDCDNWCLRMHAVGRDHRDSYIRTKARELREALFAQTPEGKKLRNLYFVALEDKGFQEFRDKVTALAELEKPKSRRRRAEQASGEGDHD
ncbi:hypothetical protein [Burkholderia sp. RF4-BP95]|uniref:hypothetical protein n=1 Tax=Burkholderia sp. RF4-BP95 TaxID=1637845 RepID=UPI000AA7605C|nr:hypothetical protein [Burkholderia sp. RF4-BP95]